MPIKENIFFYGSRNKFSPDTFVFRFILLFFYRSEGFVFIWMIYDRPLCGFWRTNVIEPKFNLTQPNLT